MFIPNRKFRRDYNHIFKQDPMAANIFLLIAELADEHGQVATSDEEIAVLMATRFTDPTEYALGGDQHV